MQKQELLKAIEVLENIEARVKGLIKNRQVNASVESYLKEFVLNADLKQSIVDLKAAKKVNATTNLIEKYKDSDIRDKFAKWKVSKKYNHVFSDTNGTHKVGDVVKFLGGIDNNIEFTSEILGFNEEGKAFMLWDCYWFPVDLENRKV